MRERRCTRDELGAQAVGIDNDRGAHRIARRARRRVADERHFGRARARGHRSRRARRPPARRHRVQLRNGGRHRDRRDEGVRAPAHRGRARASASAVATSPRPVQAFQPPANDRAARARLRADERTRPDGRARRRRRRNHRDDGAPVGDQQVSRRSSRMLLFDIRLVAVLTASPSCPLSLRPVSASTSVGCVPSTNTSPSVVAFGAPSGASSPRPGDRSSLPRRAAAARTACSPAGSCAARCRRRSAPRPSRPVRQTSADCHHSRPIRRSRSPASCRRTTC